MVKERGQKIMTKSETGNFIDVFDLSNYTNLNTWDIEAFLSRKFYDYYIGISRLRGQGPLMDL
jgi:hypothetical protein